MEYKAEQIEVLEGLEGVRRHPGMYLGAIGAEGAFKAFQEILSNAIDEAIDGHAKTISVWVDERDTFRFTVVDDGRGIPFDEHPEYKISALTLVATRLHAGGKFNAKSYTTSGGLHGVGLSVVNALSKRLRIVVRRGKQIVEQTFERGQPITDLKEVEGDDAWTLIPHGRTGTRVEVELDPEIFNERPPFKWFQEHVSNLAALFEKITFYFNGEYVKASLDSFLPNCKNVLRFDDDSERVRILVAPGTGRVRGFINGLPVDRGVHIEKLFDFLTKIFKRLGVDARVSEIKQCFDAVVSMVLPTQVLEFRGQEKSELFGSKAGQTVHMILIQVFDYWVKTRQSWFQQRAKEVRSRVKRLRKHKQEQIEASEAAKSISSVPVLAGRFVAPRKWENAELYIVEGQSAGGNAKKARLPHQGVLSLRGKVLNVAKTSLKSLVANKETIAILTALGAKKTGELQFDFPNGFAFEKVILAADADPDGQHIVCLLLTWFALLLPEYVKEGRLYIARPPLYAVKFKNGVTRYFRSKQEFETLTGIMRVTRFKGLGEMNDIQLRETIFDPAQRVIVQVRWDGSHDLLLTLMGSDLEVRKQYLFEHLGMEHLYHVIGLDIEEASVDDVF